MALTCGICSTSCKKAESIVCVLCNTHQHINCIIKQTPPLHQAALDNISKNKPAFSFGCSSCFKDSPMNPMTTKIDAVERQLLDLTNLIKDSVTLQLTDIKVELAKSLENNKLFEKETSSKIEKLENENNFLRKQFNRSDIIVSGLPGHLHTPDLYPMAISIAKACDVNIGELDINFCVRIRNKSAVLIKFNNILKRDLVMQNYRTKYNLNLKDVLDTDIDKRLYLNNHLTPIEAKLHYICRSKLKSNEIKSYRIIASNPVSVKLVYPDNKEAVLNLTEMIDHTS